MPPKKLKQAAQHSSPPSSSFSDPKSSSNKNNKRRKKCSTKEVLFFFLTFMVLFWFASTWIVSLSATSANHGTITATTLGKRRHAKDISSYFTKKKGKTKNPPPPPPPLPPPIEKVVNLKHHDHNKNAMPLLPLTAYIEGPLPPLDPTKTPRLPSRNPSSPLEKIVYSSDGETTCFDFPNAFPIRVPPSAKDISTDSSDCPIMKDPFLPWIHDAFLSADHSVVHLIAHNQRRCNTNPKEFYKRLLHLEPQVILQQSVPIKTIIQSKTNDAKDDEYQYQLTSIENADPESKETRFLCRFHDQHDEQIGNITFSRYPYNYEHANYQKRNTFPLLTRPTSETDTKKELHNEQVWNSLLQFQCPIPPQLQQSILQQNQQQQQQPSHNDNQYYVDIIPIRTYGRLDRAGYFDRSLSVRPGMKSDDVIFDPILEWGTNHILPPISNSGRWTNIPLCPYNQHQQDVAESKKDKQLANIPFPPPPPPLPPPVPQQQQQDEKYFLTACVWASASFTTRGSNDPDTSTSQRLLEWLTYQLYMAGFDHVYIFDNSKTTITLEPVIQLFPTTRVTRIPWKHPVCNNNKPGSINPGERSSQYTAEASCRVRFGHETKWMAVLDIDEYLIPQPPYQSIRDWLQQKYSHGDTRVLSFYQTRAIPNVNIMEPISSPDNNSDDKRYQWKKHPKKTFLETYNCDKHMPFPKPGWAWRAKKQIFQPSYVLMHFVHYTLVTKRLLDLPSEASGLYNDRPPYEKRVDERTEAFMLHTKTTAPPATQYWKKQCRPTNNKDKDNNCPIGFPFPTTGGGDAVVNKEGMQYNCHIHEHITSDIVPKLEALLEPLKLRYDDKSTTNIVT